MQENQKWVFFSEHSVHVKFFRFAVDRTIFFVPFHETICDRILQFSASIRCRIFMSHWANVDFLLSIAVTTKTKLFLCCLKLAKLF